MLIVHDLNARHAVFTLLSHKLNLKKSRLRPNAKIFLSLQVPSYKTRNTEETVHGIPTICPTTLLA